MALRHVDQTGNPAAVWKYPTKAATLVRSYALYAANVACLELLGIMGRSESPGCREIIQSQVPVDSRKPLITAVPCLSFTMTALKVKVTAHWASHRGSSPIKVWRKPGMRCLLVINSDGRWGKAKFTVPADCCVCPVAAPTVILGTARSMLITGELAENYMSIALESTMPVVLFCSARLRILWVQLAVNLLMSGKGKCGDVVPRVEI